VQCEGKKQVVFDDKLMRFHDHDNLMLNNSM
jgi:hypothetical protein